MSRGASKEAPPRPTRSLMCPAPPRPVVRGRAGILRGAPENSGPRAPRCERYPQEIRLQLLYLPTTEDDEYWMKSVVEIGQTLEYGKQLEKLIKGENSNPQDKGKGKADKKNESKESGTDKPKKPDLQDLKTGELFRRPSFGKTKTDAA